MSTFQFRIVLLFLMLIMQACTDSSRFQTLEGQAQGTTYHIRFWTEDGRDIQQLSRSVADEFAAIDTGMSGYKPDSGIERFNAMRDSEVHEVDSEIVKLVELARSVNKASNGCYDLTIKPLFELWGFTADQLVLPEPQKIQETLALIGMDKLTVLDATHMRKTMPGLRVDLSSIGQGYSVARIAAVLERQGIQNYLVEIGGELLIKGRKPEDKPWRVAIEKPLPEERSVEKIITINGPGPLAVMTSGTYRHFFDNEGVRYSHILDARTGYPIKHATVSVTVLYSDATMADAWSTALLCLGREAGLKTANENGIPVLFIELTGKKTFSETSSQALLDLPGIAIE